MRRQGISCFILYANQMETMKVVMPYSAILLAFRNSHDFHCFLSTSL